MVSVFRMPGGRPTKNLMPSSSRCRGTSEAGKLDLDGAIEDKGIAVLSGEAKTAEKAAHCDGVVANVAQRPIAETYPALSVTTSTLVETDASTLSTQVKGSDCTVTSASTGDVTTMPKLEEDNDADGRTEHLATLQYDSPSCGNDEEVAGAKVSLEKTEGGNAESGQQGEEVQGLKILRSSVVPYPPKEPVHGDAEGSGHFSPQWHEDGAKVGRLSRNGQIFTKIRKGGAISLLYERRLRRRGLHGYSYTIVEGDVSAADGLGFVFANRVPCGKNVQTLWTVFVNRSGFLCKRRSHSITRETDKSLFSLSAGCRVIMTIDLNCYSAHFEMENSAGLRRSTHLDFTDMAKEIDCSAGYFCVVVTEMNTTVKLTSPSSGAHNYFEPQFGGARWRERMPHRRPTECFYPAPPIPYFEGFDDAQMDSRDGRFLPRRPGSMCSLIPFHDCTGMVTPTNSPHNICNLFPVLDRRGMIPSRSSPHRMANFGANYPHELHHLPASSMLPFASSCDLPHHVVYPMGFAIPAEAQHVNPGCYASSPYEMAMDSPMGGACFMCNSTKYPLDFYGSGTPHAPTSLPPPEFCSGVLNVEVPSNSFPRPCLEHHLCCVDSPFSDCDAMHLRRSASQSSPALSGHSLPHQYEANVPYSPGCSTVYSLEASPAHSSGTVFLHCNPCASLDGGGCMHMTEPFMMPSYGGSSYHTPSEGLYPISDMVPI